MAKIDEIRQAQLLNYALGESTPAERAELERLLKTDAALLAELEEIRATIGLAEEALLREPIPKLPPRMLEHLRSEMQRRPERAPGLFGFSANRYVALAAAAVLVIVVGVVFRNSLTEGPAPFKVARETQPEPQIESAPPAGLLDADAGAAPESKEDAMPIGQKIEAFIIAGSQNDFTLTVAQELTKGVPAPAAPGAELAKDTAQGVPKAAMKKSARSDNAPAAPEENAAEGAGAEAPRARPARIAMMATAITIPSTDSLLALRGSESAMADCLRDGFEADALLTVRVTIGVGETPSKVETVSANKMPLRDRACIAETVENTKFTGAPEGASFTLTIKPLEN
ncbi:MAG TPA: hypothetical protein VFV50_03975 [Bdellovibrionales bacterium]|nr:hypothetical protein [Bdellovibrionales bacterium]